MLACHVRSPVAIPRRNAPSYRGRATARRPAFASAGLSADLCLLFDCDGVLVETERDGHRVSFNAAFKNAGIEGVEWGVEKYGELLKIGGGKERLTSYFNEAGWPSVAPESEDERKAWVKGLHEEKTTLFMEMVERGDLPLRPGVRRLVDEALAADAMIGVCSTSNERSVRAVVETMLGQERAAHMKIFAGDVVSKKKPDPAIYNLAKEHYGVGAGNCVVIEDSRIGLLAAKGAGMNCIVTKSIYTAGENFSEADMVVDELGDTEGVNLDTLLQFTSMDFA